LVGGLHKAIYGVLAQIVSFYTKKNFTQHVVKSLFLRKKED